MRDWLNHAVLNEKGVNQWLPGSIRGTVDLSEYPELLVIYLGMRVRTLAGIKRLFGLGPQIAKAGQARPEGLLHCDNGIIYSLFPLHVGMRWYWKHFERWSIGLGCLRSALTRLPGDAAMTECSKLCTRQKCR